MDIWRSLMLYFYTSNWPAVSFSVTVRVVVETVGYLSQWMQLGLSFDAPYQQMLGKTKLSAIVLSYSSKMGTLSKNIPVQKPPH